MRNASGLPQGGVLGSHLYRGQIRNGNIDTHGMARASVLLNCINILNFIHGHEFAYNTIAPRHGSNILCKGGDVPRCFLWNAYGRSRVRVHAPLWSAPGTLYPDFCTLDPQFQSPESSYRVSDVHWRQLRPQNTHISSKINAKLRIFYLIFIYIILLCQ